MSQPEVLFPVAGRGPVYCGGLHNRDLVGIWM